MTTHAELVAAVEEYRGKLPAQLRYQYLNAHLDTLAAILNLHDDGNHVGADGWCEVCSDDRGPKDWPCPTVGIVVDALRKMGAL